MLNTILLFVLTYIIITIFVNLMIFYVNDEFKDLNKFNLFYRKSENTRDFSDERFKPFHLTKNKTKKE